MFTQILAISYPYLLSQCRRLWNWFEYILFFYNTIVGFVAAIFRVLISALFGLLLLFRLDTVILMKGFEFGDTGMLVCV